ncbi:peptidase E [Microbacterium esteraromaticum]|uniref:Type 1 glutamine amidotransferase-like domain-containing protein n=1 Tax=Microbacterium esteraromaticum TaxID=57043 RepID=UPI0028F70432|nr:peptidase E [Microbacterium esteraromaticum]
MSAAIRGTIVTLGGGGFSMSDDGTSAIDDLLLDLTGRERPKVCFVPTASGDSLDYSSRFEAAFAGRAETSVLSLFGNRVYDYTDPEMLRDQDVIYVGGGSTANLLAIWRLHGVPEVLRAAAADGTILAGISAGMNCWFDASSTDSFGPIAPLRDGLGFLPGSACPHYLGEPGRREKYLDWVGSGALPEGVAADDFSALIWRDGELVEAVSEQPGRPIFQVECRDGVGVEREIPVRQLTAR